MLNALQYCGFCYVLGFFLVICCWKDQFELCSYYYQDVFSSWALTTTALDKLTQLNHFNPLVYFHWSLNIFPQEAVRWIYFGYLKTHMWNFIVCFSYKTLSVECQCNFLKQYLRKQRMQPRAPALHLLPNRGKSIYVGVLNFSQDRREGKVTTVHCSFTEEI